MQRNDRFVPLPSPLLLRLVCLTKNQRDHHHTRVAEMVSLSLSLSLHALRETFRPERNLVAQSRDTGQNFDLVNVFHLFPPRHPTPPFYLYELDNSSAIVNFAQSETLSDIFSEMGLK